MSVIFTILLFLVVLVVLILVHELGHFVAAKLTKMRVDEFGIGFPPMLYGVKKGETFYSLNALPLGGFVSIFGEDPQKLTEADPDRTRAFGARPKWAQIIVLLAGVFMNIVLAFFLLVAVNVMGVPTAIEESNITESARLQVVNTIPESPADRHLPAGATIVGVSGVNGELEILTPSSLSQYVTENGSETITVSYLDFGDKEVQNVDITPVTGLIAEEPDRAAIGTSLALVDDVNLPLWPAITTAFYRTGDLLVAITFGIINLFSGIFTGTADLSQVAGPIGIAGYVGEAAAVGITSLLFFVAVISLNLAVVNLLPLPALDGGRLVFVLIETITRRPINPVWVGRINVAGFLLLMALMVAVTIGDVIRIW